MPRYDYECEKNGWTVEVRHGIHEKLTTWGEVCERAEIDPGDTPLNTPVERLISAPSLAFPKGNSELKGMGFTKLVRRSDGNYENVTATGDESRVVKRDDAASIEGLNLAKKVGD